MSSKPQGNIRAGNSPSTFNREGIESPLNSSTDNIKGSVSTLRLARVVETVVDRSSGPYTNPIDLSRIKFIYENNDIQHTGGVASPMFPMLGYLPIKNELVFILNNPSIMGDSRFFYLPSLNILNTGTYNVDASIM